MPTTLEITPEYMTCGDFDSRKRYLRVDASGPAAICSGVTWEIGNGVIRVVTQSNAPWCPWRFEIPGYLTIDARTQTHNGGTIGTDVDAPSSTLTRVNF
jgi:hypothetical protein